MYVVCRGAPGGLIRDPDFTYSRARDLLVWLRSVAPAIVVPNWVWSAFDICELARRRGIDVRTLAYCRSDSDDNYYDPLVARQNQFEWAAAVSSECQTALAARLPQKADRIRFVPTFVDRPQRLTRTWEHEPVRLLFVGRLIHEDKRVLDLLDVARRLLLADVDFTLTIVGEGPMTVPLLDGLAEIRHGGRVRLVGTIAPDDMGVLYRQHDIFVQLSSVEGLSNALLEAMSNGVVPIVTETRSGVSGVVTHGVNGLLVAVGDMAALARHVASLSRSRSTLETMGVAAHGATHHYGWEPYSERFETLLREIESSPPSS